MKTTAKFRASRRLRFADTKRIMSPEISPKSFGTFEKQAPGYQINWNVVSFHWISFVCSLFIADTKDDEWEDCGSIDSMDEEVEEEVAFDINMVGQLFAQVGSCLW